MNALPSLFKHTTVLFLLLAVGLALVLFSVKYQVQDLEEELGQLNREIANERQATHVLKAEFSYLTDAERLRRLSDRYLDLEPVQPRQIGSFAALSASPDRADETSGDTSNTMNPPALPAAIEEIER
jgi:cell division protein FtsL